MIAVIIPAFNEAESVASVASAAAQLVDLVIVVDDGSTDTTAEEAHAAGALVVSHRVNAGVGAAISTGLGEARRRGADVIVQIDGDGQHGPSSLERIVARVRGGSDLVVGTRFEHGFEMSRARRVVLRLFAWAISRRIGLAVDDPTSGFRGFSARAADSLAPVFPRKYLSDTVEVLFVAAELGLSIATEPVTMRQRQGGEASVGVVRGVGYTLRIVTIIAKHSMQVGVRG